MSQVADSMLFRKKLYEMFKDSGLQNKLKTTLRANLLQKLQKPNQLPITQPETGKNMPFHLKNKFIQSMIAEHLKQNNIQYSLSIFMAECDLQEQDCLRYNQLSQILNLGIASDGQSLLFRLIEQFGRVRCQQARERSTQTDFDQPLSKKLQILQKDYRSKIDYWKLIPNNNANKNQQVLDTEQRLKHQFTLQKDRLKRDLQTTLKQQIEKKVENQYNFRLRQAQKQHQGRLNELKLREKAILDGLQRKKKELQQKSRSISEEQQKLINKYQTKMIQLQADYRRRTKQLQQKQKDFWKKQLELRAKKRQYQQTIRLVKQKVIVQSGGQ